MLERGLVSCSAVMNGDPPFVSVDAAENCDSSGKMVRLRGQLCNFSSESLKTEFGDLSLQSCKVGVEDGLSPFAKRKVCESRKDGTRKPLNPSLRSWQAIGTLERGSINTVSCSAFM
jgi:hypothetical protein